MTDTEARRLWADVTGPDGYLPVFALLLAASLANLLVGSSHLGALGALVLSEGALVVTVFHSTVRPHVRRTAVALAGIALTLALAGPLIAPHTGYRAGWLGLLANAVVAAAALPLMLTRALQHRRVTANTLLAALSGYLLIGVLFGYVYHLHGVVAPPFFAGEGDPSPGKYLYFSFVTLTTVGFGDLVPGSDPARGYVMLEAVAGQLFVVTTLARVVSLLGEDRPRRRPPA